MIRGRVIGLSMWPNLIDGDILSAREIPASEIRPGMITVFRDADGKNPVVHRVRAARNSMNTVFVTTSGDNSGKDAYARVISQLDKVTVVNGVLRIGRYRKITRFYLCKPLNCRFLVRLHRFLVRNWMW